MKKAFYLLIGLILFDFIITFIGLTYFNAHEINTIYHQYGLINFFIIKLVASIMALIVLYYVSTYYKNIALGTIYFSILFYGVIGINNLYVIST